MVKPAQSSKAGPSQSGAITSKSSNAYLPTQDSDDDDDYSGLDDNDEEDPELEDSEEDEFEEDRARTKGVAVWADDDEGDEDVSEEDEEDYGRQDEESNGEGYSEDEEEPVEKQSKGKGKDKELARLQNDLRTLPLATLLKAKQSLPKSTGPDSDEEDQAQAKAARVAEAREKLAVLMRGKNGGKNQTEDKTQQKKERERREKVKRDNKHAPMEMSSKRQVSRRRDVIEIEKVERRDPRFSSLSGTVDPHLHNKAYSFLPDLLTNEYHDLRMQLKTAQKRLSSVPRAERAAKEREIEQIELELSRVRTRKEKDERAKRERDALQNWKKEERAKRGEGKGEWHLKDSEKKRILAEAKHSALLAQGGQFAVKKAIEKKRKKDAGKEKKARPRGLGFGSGGGGGGGGGGDGAPRKRVRM